MKLETAAAAFFAFGICFQNAAHGQQRAQDQGDWPCRQIKVASVALAGVWTGPPIGAAAKVWRDDAAVSDLVARIGARRTPIGEAARLIADFGKNAGDQRKERLTRLFAGVYERLDTERGVVISGLERYGRKQKDMAERLRNATQAMREQQDQSPADPVKLKQASDALLWEMRVFDERRKALGFVCETPALIEQRLGALARAILAAME